MAKKKPDRAQLLKLIETNCRYLVRCNTDESFRELEGVEMLTGWLGNRGSMTHEELANGIIALSAVIDLEALINTAHGAVFYRRKYDGYTWERSDRFADDALALAGVDVVAWNAAIAEDEAVAA